jgi:hypothetical protein
MRPGPPAARGAPDWAIGPWLARPGTRCRQPREPTTVGRARQFRVVRSEHVETFPDAFRPTGVTGAADRRCRAPVGWSSLAEVRDRALAVGRRAALAPALRCTDAAGGRFSTRLACSAGGFEPATLLKTQSEIYPGDPASPRE